jgi:hypothetical protein
MENHKKQKKQTILSTNDDFGEVVQVPGKEKKMGRNTEN